MIVKNGVSLPLNIGGEDFHLTKSQVFCYIPGIIGYNTPMKKFDVSFPLDRSNVVEMLQHYRISPTRQRVEIAEFLFQAPQHLSADKILDGVKAAGNRVSRATVYNTMGLFAQKGVVREVLVDRERVFYDTNTSNHHHLYNVDTGELSDIYDIDIGIGMVSDTAIPDGMSVINTDVVVKVSSRSAA